MIISVLVVDNKHNSIKGKETNLGSGRYISHNMDIWKDDVFKTSVSCSGTNMAKHVCVSYLMEISCDFISITVAKPPHMCSLSSALAPNLNLFLSIYKDIHLSFSAVIESSDPSRTLQAHQNRFRCHFFSNNPDFSVVGPERSSRSPLSVLPGRKTKTPKTKIFSFFMPFLSSTESQGTNKHSISFRGQQVKNNNSVNIQFAAETAHFSRPSPVMIWVFHLATVLHIPLFSEAGQLRAASLTCRCQTSLIIPKQRFSHVGSVWRYFIYRLHFSTSHFPADAVISCDLTWSVLTLPFQSLADRLEPPATLASTFLPFALPARTDWRPGICRLSAMPGLGWLVFRWCNVTYPATIVPYYLENLGQGSLLWDLSNACQNLTLLVPDLLKCSFLISAGSFEPFEPRYHGQTEKSANANERGGKWCWNQSETGRWRGKKTQ